VPEDKEGSLNSYLLQMDEDFKKNTPDAIKCVRRFKE
jgi:hypothetical protein